MGLKAHIICAKCGSDDMYFKIGKQTFEFAGAYLCCTNCGELTGLNEWNEFNGYVDETQKYSEDGYIIYEDV